MIEEETEKTEGEAVNNQRPSLSDLRFLGYLLFECLLSFVIGCGSSDGTGVSGTVTLDGQPLKDGTIQFAPTDGKAPSQAAVIHDGKFSTKLQQTNYRVEIHATKLVDTGAKLDEKGPGGGPTAVELLPARYNVQSELTLKVDGPRSDARFELKSK